MRFVVRETRGLLQPSVGRTKSAEQIAYSVHDTGNLWTNCGEWASDDKINLDKKIGAGGTYRGRVEARRLAEARAASLERES